MGGSLGEASVLTDEEKFELLVPPMYYKADEEETIAFLPKLPKARRYLP